MIMEVSLDSMLFLFKILLSPMSLFVNFFDKILDYFYVISDYLAFVFWFFPIAELLPLLYIVIAMFIYRVSVAVILTIEELIPFV